MRKRPETLLLAAIIIAGTSLFALPALAICPVCTVAVAGGVGLSRYFGIDDSVTGLWIGGLTVSMILWTLDWMERKGYRFRFDRSIVWIGYWVMIVLPLYLNDIFFHPFNRLWGMDKLLLGILVGAAALFSGGTFHFRAKRKNGGKVYFPFQKVVFAIAPLIVLSAVFYWITK